MRIRRAAGAFATAHETCVGYANYFYCGLRATCVEKVKELQYSYIYTSLPMLYGTFLHAGDEST